MSTTSSKQQRQRTLHTWRDSEMAHEILRDYSTLWWQQYNSTLLRRRSRNTLEPDITKKTYIDCIVPLQRPEPIKQPTSAMPESAQEQMPNEKALNLEQELIASASVWPASYIFLLSTRSTWWASYTEKQRQTKLIWKCTILPASNVLLVFMLVFMLVFG